MPAELTNVHFENEDICERRQSADTWS